MGASDGGWRSGAGAVRGQPEDCSTGRTWGWVLHHTRGAWVFPFVNLQWFPPHLHVTSLKLVYVLPGMCSCTAKTIWEWGVCRSGSLGTFRLLWWVLFLKILCKINYSTSLEVLRFSVIIAWVLHSKAQLFKGVIVSQKLQFIIYEITVLPKLHTW